MKSSEYISILQSNTIIDKEIATALEEIIQEYPFFQSARAVYLKYLHDNSSFRYNSTLKVTAAHTLDRTVLFDYITSTDFKTAELTTTVAELVIEEVVVPEIVVPEITEEVVIEEVVIEEVEALEEVPEVEETPQLIETLDYIKEIVIEGVDVVGFESEIEQEQEVAIEQELPEIVIETIEEVNVVEEVVASEIDVTNEIIEEVIVEEVKEIEALSEEIQLSALEEKLSIGKPLQFSKTEKHSFQEWLQLTSFKPIQREPEPEIIEEEIIVEEEKSQKSTLIDKFIKANPRMPKATAYTSSAKVGSVLRPENNTMLMTETLAQVYLEQKKYDRAVQAYEILILKYPEKSSLFADRIKDIKVLQQNNS